VFELDSICARCRRQQIRFSSNRQLADDPRWLSVVDHPAQIVRTGRKHGPGLIILGTVHLIRRGMFLGASSVYESLLTNYN
jgi:surfeit locus 1 family protein